MQESGQCPQGIGALVQYLPHSWAPKELARVAGWCPGRGEAAPSAVSGLAQWDGGELLGVESLSAAADYFWEVPGVGVGTSHGCDGAILRAMLSAG